MIDLGFDVWVKSRIRFYGVDTWESRTRDKIEKKFGLASKAMLKRVLGKTTILQTTINKKGEDMKGKFGRVLGDFLYKGKPVSKLMCREGYAVPYFGGNKAKLKAKHMANRRKLIKAGTVQGDIE
jgi:endonuclease YncB( thermonuclease family)